MTVETSAPWPAPAKLNLFLHIVGRRPNGYHELQTCFQFVELADEVTIVVRDDGKISRSIDIPGVPVDEDLCVRAAQALKAAAGTALGADIGLLKRIPIGGGLGGGSSDAATCLVALNHLWRLGWSSERLRGLGLLLGADVPVFISGRVAWAEGIGDQLVSLYPPNAPNECIYLILKPKVSISTAAVFASSELTRNSPAITIHGFLASGGRNDCLSVVRRHYPEVAEALDWLSRFGAARLTGTGACVFLACETLDRGCEILRQVPPSIDAYLTRGLNDSPLLKRLADG